MNPGSSTDSSPDDPAATPAELGFAGCLSELDVIVRGLETDAIDVDHLSASVERAAELVEWCRECLGDTRTRLDEVLPRLELSNGPAEDTSDGDESHGDGSDRSGEGPDAEPG
ncbi:MAG: exodeoxyribonuclease VII small subunit [Microthrixaceae bacterium]